jgi:uncharacterized protein (TIGR03435 family)
MHRAPISACVGLVLACGIATTATAQDKATHQPARRAVHTEQESAPALVHITPTTQREGETSIQIGGDRWIARGFDVKALLSEIYDIDVRRIDLPDSVAAGARYDVALMLPQEVDEDTMQEMLESAVERRFGLKITRENRSVDVYVLTAPNGPGAALHLHGGHGIPTLVTARAGASAGSASDDAGQIRYFGKDCSGIASGGISASAGTIGEFRRTLEPDLDRLLVDETNLTGSYDFKIGNYTNQQELFKLLHDELGLVVVPAQRSVTMLTVRPAQEMQAAL